MWACLGSRYEDIYDCFALQTAESRMEWVVSIDDGMQTHKLSLRQAIQQGYTFLTDGNLIVFRAPFDAVGVTTSKVWGSEGTACVLVTAKPCSHSDLCNAFTLIYKPEIPLQKSLVLSPARCLQNLVWPPLLFLSLFSSLQKWTWPGFTRPVA